MAGNLFVEVLLPLPLPGKFTYSVPTELNVKVAVGKRVVVQFGRRKIYTALVTAIHVNPPQGYQVKPVLDVLDEHPVVLPAQFEFWNWIASYYLCTEGEVMNAALPSGLKLASETIVRLNSRFDGDISNLNEKEYLVVEALTNQSSLNLTKIARITDQQKVVHLVKNLINKGVVEVEEDISESYKPRKEHYVTLSAQYVENEELLSGVMDALGKRAYKQLELLLSFLSMAKNREAKTEGLKKQDLLKKAGAGDVPLKALIKKGVFEIITRVVSRFYDGDATNAVADIRLNKHQKEAFENILNGFKDEKAVLLHGVTASGKTELYIKLIEKVIAQGKQALYLLPEIALTAQIINRLRKYFGKDVGIYHSKHNEAERVEIWNRVNGSIMKENLSQYKIILGARSALFLPFEKLGLVIIDEEHDHSFKQYDPAPRYNARDAAIYLARMHGAYTLLGSATPSVESYFNAQSGKYHLVELMHRHTGVMLPEIAVANLREETKQKKLQSHFSSTLLENITLALKNKEQIILFQNRRGFSLFIECENCGWVPECKYCDVTLTYHKAKKLLCCHYCGYKQETVTTCPKCNSARVKMHGFGTEKIEDELPLFFPHAKIARMDLDTTRSKQAHHQIIQAFEDREIDILVGTQMVTKGLDFDNVSVVGVLNADNMINFPDFRSYERSFQLIAQVSGRAGRKNKQGKVIIQTYNPAYPVIKYATANDYFAMYSSQLMERRKFRYPPFYRLIRCTVRHRNSEVVDKAASELAAVLRKALDKRVLGPEFPVVSRIKNEYLKNILIKIERGPGYQKIKQEVKGILDEFSRNPSFKGVRVVVDVDPL